MVTISAAMLNAVRYSGYRRLTLKVHCVHTPATATRSAGRIPSSSSAIRLAAYETDSVDPLPSEIGRLIFQADVRHDVTTRKANNPGGGTARGKNVASRTAPDAMTSAT